jgi:uncharacterized tellurite resistance protein B-like protein
MSTSIDHVEAAVGILAAVAHADGVVVDDEAAWWRRIRRRHPLFAAVPHEEMEAILRRVEATLEVRPWTDAVADWAARLPPALGAEIGQLALDLLHADGDAAPAEQDLAIAFARALGRDR